MQNFTEAINNLETTTAVGQNISEEDTPDLMNSFMRSMKDFHLYGLIILVPIGITFNSISLVIFQRSKAFTTSVGTHLKCVSISDSIMLVGTLLTNTDKYWDEKLNFPNIYSMNKTSCKIFTYILGVGNASAGLIMSSATIERFLAIAFPLKYRSWNTQRTSGILLSFFFIYSLGASASTFFILGISEKGECDVIKENIKTAELLYIIFVVVIANVICGGVILIFTIIIIVLLLNQKRKRNSLSNNSDNSKTNKEMRISVMLVTITLFFILLRFPKVIAMMFTFANSGEQLVTHPVAKLTSVFVAVNHSVNFIIYMMFLESFRKTFFEMFSWFHVKIIECLYICRNENQDDA